MIKESGLTLELIARSLMDAQNEMGILLIESDVKGLLNELCKDLKCKNAIAFYGEECVVLCHIKFLGYKALSKNRLQITSELVEDRMSAIKCLFDRWGNMGFNVRHAKSPFRCKTFMKYLDKIGFRDADYLILLYKKDEKSDSCSFCKRRE